MIRQKQRRGVPWGESVSAHHRLFERPTIEISDAERPRAARKARRRRKRKGGSGCADEVRGCRHPRHEHSKGHQGPDPEKNIILFVSCESKQRLRPLLTFLLPHARGLPGAVNKNAEGSPSRQGVRTPAEGPSERLKISIAFIISAGGAEAR